MKVYIVAKLQAVEKGEIIGYRIINIETEEVNDVQTRRLCQMVEYTGVEVVNGDVNLQEEKIRINQGSEDAYPTILIKTGEFVKGNMAHTVLGKNIDGAYVVVNPIGIVSGMSEKNVINLSNSKGLTNAKVSKGRLAAKKGSITDIVGFNYNYLEKKFKTENNRGYVQEWLVRIIKNGEPYGRKGVLVNDNDTLVEFISLDSSQFVGRYYLSTMLEHDIRYGLDLHGGVDAWSIESKHLKEILKWLGTIK